MKALEYLKDFPMFGKPGGYKPGLERVAALLAALQNPHEKVPAIHIAGTNGKGSTAMILASILQEAGIRTGLYTSPELVSFLDRIRINGENITYQELEEEVDLIRSVIKDLEGPLRKPTFFEVITAVAFHYFQRKKADLVVLEVGLGGRLDATNLCHSLMSIITNISLEHTGILGNTLREIAREKGGIIKRGQKVLSAAKEEEVIEELMKICQEKEAELYLLRKDFFVEAVESSLSGQSFHFSTKDQRLRDLKLSLLGRHQLDNAALALGVVGFLQGDLAYEIPEGALRRGLSKASWPGRLEVISHQPAIIIDGAHNPGGIKTLVEFLRHAIDYDNLHLLLGILEDKDKDLIFKDLLPLASKVILTKSESHRACEPSLLAHVARRYSSHVLVEPDFQRALDISVKGLGEGDLLCVAGSLYTMSLARRYLPHLLKKTGHISSSKT